MVHVVGTIAEAPSLIEAAGLSIIAGADGVHDGAVGVARLGELGVVVGACVEIIAALLCFARIAKSVCSTD